ncbi:MAG: hypothetical protein IKE65_00005, partial [Clostridia bacterium]|nr:hypothetical protein [Clostridia bacterium]
MKFVNSSAEVYKGTPSSSWQKHKIAVDTAIFTVNVFRLFRRAEQTTTRYAGVQHMLYIVNALRVEC